MAHPTAALVIALRRTAVRLRQGVRYRWSNFAVCNCGNLAQTITELSPDAIYEAAMEPAGDWGEQAQEYCATSGLSMDRIVGQILELGFEREDVRHLERLTHPHVLRRIDPERLPLRHTRAGGHGALHGDLADLLEERLDELGRERLAGLMRAAEARDAAA